MKQEIPNKNGNYYSPDVIKEAYKDAIGKFVYGPDGTDLKDVAGVIEGVQVGENRVELTLRFLETPMGTIMKKFLEKKDFVIREKAYGNVEDGVVKNMLIDSFNIVYVEGADKNRLVESIDFVGDKK
jgi:hypothetical protein